MEIVADNAGHLICSAIDEVMMHGKERSSRGLKYKEICNVTLRLTNPLANLFIIPQRMNCPFCFTGDTKISLLNGTEVPIKDLVGVPEFWVYSCTPEGKIVPGRGHSARVTKKVSELVKVTLDNGESVKCTPDHLWMLRDGTYREAQHLKPGDSLMPLYRRYNGQYEEIFHSAGWELTHQMVVREHLGGYKSHVRKLGTNHVVCHHRDINPRNNDPRNLEVVTSKWHRIYHNKISEAGRRALLKYITSEEGRNSARQRVTERNKSTENSRRISIRNLLDWSNSNSGLRKSIGGTRSSSIRAAWGNGSYNNVFGDHFREVQSSKAHSLNKVGAVCDHCGREFGNIGALGKHKKSLVNHKVVDVVSIEEDCDVYDITVDFYNNFALSSGVFVHNSMIGETFWVYSGRSDTVTLEHLLKRANDFSDDNLFWRGGYGNRLFYPVNQIESAFDKIVQDPDTRQAVMAIFQPIDAMAVPANQAQVNIDQFKTKDVPCNDLIQFLLRDGKLHMTTYCRSNDAIWGFSGINLYEFTLLQQAMAACLHAEVGDYVHHVGSLHVYDKHYKRAQDIVDEGHVTIPVDKLDFPYNDIREFLRDCQVGFLKICGEDHREYPKIMSRYLAKLAQYIKLFYYQDMKELSDRVKFDDVPKGMEAFVVVAEDYISRNE